MNSPSPAKVRVPKMREPEWMPRFNKYWEAMHPAIIPDNHWRELALGAFSNGYIAGQFDAACGRLPAKGANKGGK